jgi:hypothetical protein
LGQWGIRGGELGQFFGPSGVAVGGHGNLYVVETLGDRVQKFASDGKALLQWAAPAARCGRKRDTRIPRVWLPMRRVARIPS